MATQTKDTGYAWALLAAITFVFMVSGGFLMSIGVYFAVFLEEFQESAATTAWLSSLHYGSCFLIGKLNILDSLPWCYSRLYNLFTFLH